MGEPLSRAECEELSALLWEMSHGQLDREGLAAMRRLVARDSARAFDAPEAELRDLARLFLGMYAHRYNYWERESWYRPGEAPTAAGSS